MCVNMKISIITFHNTSNFGASLQCVALSHYLVKLGHEVEVVNYLPAFVRDKKSIFKEIKKVKTSKNRIRAIVKGLAYLIYTPQLIRRDKKFESFISNNLRLSRPYFNSDEVMEKPPTADLYICGSDQIWNPELTGGKLDKAFFLQFTKKRKASYGASIGEFNIEKQADNLKVLTKDFTSISVREKSVEKRLSEAIGRKVEVVLDCTLLLDKEDYRSFENDTNIIKQPYLLIYNIQNSKEAVLAAKNISRERDLAVIDISPNPFAKIDSVKKLVDIGPGEFLSLFKNAEYIITNSFHGTIFSILYEKEFFAFPHSLRAGRIVDLLNVLGLSSRLVKASSDITSDTILYSAVKEKLAEQRKHSYDYLDKLLV